MVRRGFYITPLEFLSITISIAHIFITPYTKVEESFSLHAIHDILTFGIQPPSLALYDHVEFPGSVPRSFVGPLILSALVWPFVAIGRTLNVWNCDLQVQILVRIILAFTSSCSIIFLLRRTRKAFGRKVAQYATILILTQFHLLFYVSRTLPNMFAFPLVQIVMGILISPSGTKTKRGKGSYPEILFAFGLMTFSAIVMRLELLALLGPLALMSLTGGTTVLSELLMAGIGSSLGSLALTVGVDSYFWNALIWPEGASILFNVYEGHSSDWGVSPFYFYILNSLPRLLNLAFPFGVFAMLLDRRARQIGYPVLAFVGLLSCLGHKEWRFLVYIIPTLNVCGAAGIHSLGPLFSPRHKKIVLCSTFTLNLLLAIPTFYASTLNYPGGEAVGFLSSHFSNSSSLISPFNIHIDSSTCMTGATLFNLPYSISPPQPWYISSPSSPSLIISPRPPIKYSKSETLSHDSNSKEFNQFDYVLTGGPQNFNLNLNEGGWQVIKVVKGFGGYGLSRKGVEVKMRGEVWILKRGIQS